MPQVKSLLWSALSLSSLRWRITAVLLVGSFVAYGFLLIGQYRDQHERMLEFAQSSHRALTEIMAQRLGEAIRALDMHAINRTMLETVRATRMAQGDPADADSADGNPAPGHSTTLIAFGAYGPEARLIQSYRSQPRADLSDQVLAELAAESARTGQAIDRVWSEAHLLARPIRDAGNGEVAGVVAVAWDLSVHVEAANQAILEDALKGAAAALVVIAILLYVIHQLVTRPIGELTRHVGQLSASGELGLVEDKLAARRDEIGVLANEFNKMVEALVDSRQKLQNQSYAHGMAEMASGVLHNIRNALNPISVGIWKLEERARGASLGRIDTALAELASESTPADRRAKLASYARAAAENLVTQQHALAGEIRELGQHSRHIEQILQDVDLTGRRRRKDEAINLDKLVEETAGLIPGQAGSEITVEIDPMLARLPAVLGNRILLSQVVGNLLVNAAESIRSTGVAAGRISVTGRCESLDGREMLHLEVRDTGAGITAEAMASLFQRGFSTKKEKKGGIGLHWCANSIIAMGGKIHASSDGAGAGATFHVLLPAASDARSRDRTQVA